MPPVGGNNLSSVNIYLHQNWYRPFFILRAVSADDYIVGGMFLETRYHRTCIRMSEKEYRMLRKKSAAEGMTMNKWLMKQLTEHPPICFREKEMAEYLPALCRRQWPGTNRHSADKGKGPFSIGLLLPEIWSSPEQVQSGVSLQLGAENRQRNSGESCVSGAYCESTVYHHLLQEQETGHASRVGMAEI